MLLSIFHVLNVQLLSRRPYTTTVLSLSLHGKGIIIKY